MSASAAEPMSASAAEPMSAPAAEPMSAPVAEPMSAPATTSLPWKDEYHGMNLNDICLTEERRAEYLAHRASMLSTHPEANYDEDQIDEIQKYLKKTGISLILLLAVS